MTGSDRAEAYAAGVESGAVDVCAHVRRAVERHRRDLDAAGTDAFPYRYDTDAADRVVSFIERLPHVEGRWATPLVVLEPWQCFLLCSVFGWLDGAGLRRFRTVYIEIPRKNGKSFLSAGVALYMMLADGEPGAQVYSVATTMEQASHIYKAAAGMVRRTPALRSMFGIRVSQTGAGSMATGDGCVLRPLAREQRGNLDGLNTHAAFIDELHAHKTRDVWEVMETSTSARDQPLVWAITTAGFNRASVCYEQRGYVERVLRGDVADDTYFGLVYTADAGDDWRSEAVWRKANPNYGVSIKPDDLPRKAAKAQALASQQNGFMTKHLDIWVNASVSWLNMTRWEACREEIGWDDFAGESVWIGLDLAAHIDLAAAAYVWHRDGKVYCKVRYWLPSETIERSGNALYSGWARTGHLTETPGAATDFAAIEAQLLEDDRRYRVETVAYDRFQAAYLGGNLERGGMMAVEFAQTTGNMSATMKEIEAGVMEGVFRHDGNPVTTWCFSNVQVRRDARDNVFPTREKNDPLSKIDGAVATVMALAVSDPEAAGADYFINVNEPVAA